MTLPQALGFLAAGLVLVTFGMRTMVPMRIAAIASNLAFIAYGGSLELTPVWLLHGTGRRDLGLDPRRAWRERQVFGRRLNRGRGERELDPYRPDRGTGRWRSSASWPSRRRGFLLLTELAAKTR